MPHQEAVRDAKRIKLRKLIQGSGKACNELRSVKRQLLNLAVAICAKALQLFPCKRGIVFVAHVQVLERLQFAQDSWQTSNLQSSISKCDKLLTVVLKVP